MAESPRPELAVQKRPPVLHEPSRVRARADHVDPAIKEAEIRARQAPAVQQVHVPKEKPAGAKLGKNELDPQTETAHKSEAARASRPAQHWAAGDARPLQRKNAGKDRSEPNILNPRQAAGEKARVGTAFDAAGKAGPGVQPARSNAVHALAGAASSGSRGAVGGSASPADEEERRDVGASSVKSLPSA